MLTKLATFPGRTNDGEPLVRAFHRGDSVKKAAGAMMPEIQDWLSGYRPEPDKVAVLINALGASEWWGVNSNADGFRWDALAHDCRQHEGEPHAVDEFIGRPPPNYGAWTYKDALPFMHHRNKDPNRAFGSVQLVVLNPRMRRVELVVLLDQEKAKAEGAGDVVERVDAGEPVEVSMGTRVPYDVCLVCRNKARTKEDYCDCIKKHGLGFVLRDGQVVAVDNPHPRFFDISFVYIGADKTARVMCKLASGLYLPRSVIEAELLYGRPSAADDEPMLVKAAALRTAVELDEAGRVQQTARTYEVQWATKEASPWAQLNLKALAERTGKPVEHWLAYDAAARRRNSRLEVIDQRFGPQDGLLATNSSDPSDTKIASRHSNALGEFKGLAGVLIGAGAGYEAAHALSRKLRLGPVGAALAQTFGSTAGGLAGELVGNKQMRGSLVSKPHKVRGLPKLGGFVARSTLEAMGEESAGAPQTAAAIHAYARDLGLEASDIDNNPQFMDACEKFTKERHLDKMTPKQLRDVASFLPSYARMHVRGPEKTAFDLPPSVRARLLSHTVAGGLLGAAAGGVPSLVKLKDPDVRRRAALQGALYGGLAGIGSGLAWAERPKGLEAVLTALGSTVPLSLGGLMAAGHRPEDRAAVARSEKTAEVKIGPPPSPNRREFPFVGVIDFRGLKINVENKPGDVREGKDSNGKKWRTVMKLPYGEFVGARGADKDRLDVYVGPDESSDKVYVVHQNHPKGHQQAGTYDEDKCFIGLSSADAAKKAYLEHYDDPSFFRSITEMDFEQFKRVAFPNRNGEKIADQHLDKLRIRRGECTGCGAVLGEERMAVSQKCPACAREKVAGFALEDLFTGAAQAQRRERSWRNAVSGLKTTHRGSGLGSSFSNLQKTAAKVAVDKRATQKKEADIDKELPPEDAVGQVSKLLTDGEPPMGRPLIDELAAHPLEKSLSTCSLMGIPLHPAEFQRLVLVNMGQRPLADGLEDRGLTFAPSDGEQCPCSRPLGAEHFTTGIMRALLPMLESRSYLGPVLSRRLTVVVMSPRSRPETNPEPVKNAALLTKIGRLYNGYRRQMIDAAANGAEKVASAEPELRSRLLVGNDHQLFAKQANAPAIATVGSVPLTLMYAAGLREREARGEPLGTVHGMIAHHPWLASLGAAAGVRQLMRQPAVAEFTRGMGREVSTLGQRLTQGAREVLPPR